MNQAACIDIIEVFKTESGTVSQCNKTNIYILEYLGVSTSFKASDFIDFTKRVNQINLEEMIFSSLAVTDVTVLMPPYCNRCFVLSLTDVLNLRELLSGAKFALHLNSVIWQCLRPASIW
jgi:hypothetical protein